MVGRGGLVVAAIAVAVVVAMSACALPQAEACRVYVACQAAVDPAVDTSDEAAGGACWALPDTARQCEALCREALDALLSTPSPPAVCTDGAASATAD